MSTYVPKISINSIQGQWKLSAFQQEILFLVTGQHYDKWNDLSIEEQILQESNSYTEFQEVKLKEMVFWTGATMTWVGKVGRWEKMLV